MYLDGHIFKNTSNNPEIVDDWPLHPIKDINTTTVVGACWEGKSNKMNFYFRGYLAGLFVLIGQNENPKVLSCLHYCKESLQLPPSNVLDSETELSINSDANEIIVEGKDAIDVEDMLSQVTYTNLREYPTSGRRNLLLSTLIK